MSVLLQDEVNAAYELYYSTVSEAELAEDANWADFATEQVAAICCDEELFEQVPKLGEACDG